MRLILSLRSWIVIEIEKEKENGQQGKKRMWSLLPELRSHSPKDKSAMMAAVYRIWASFPHHTTLPVPSVV